jgi:hypothetical protein
MLAFSLPLMGRLLIGAVAEVSSHAGDDGPPVERFLE